jgi:glutamyl-tRNA reductase
MTAAKHLFLLGANHRTTPLALRERLTLHPEKSAALIAALRATGLVAEYCLLNTCNRVELYAVSDEPAADRRLLAEFCRIQGLEPADFIPHAHQRSNPAAVVHLFEVAAGLDSQMVGETEILGQVKDAYAAALAAGTVGPVLNRVFQKAFHAAKVVRRETGIGEGQVSVATVAVALAERIFGRLHDSRVLVVGGGDIAEKTAKALRSREAGRVVFTNRTAARAEQLALEFAGSALPFARLADALAESDIVVSSTAAPQPVLTSPMIYAAMHRRAARPLFLIDLALPRDIDAGAAELPNVFLYNLDDLARLAEENIAQRRAEIDRARALLTGRAQDTWDKLCPTSATEGPRGEESTANGAQDPAGGPAALSPSGEGE